jgi:histidinol dehydrogenase
MKKYLYPERNVWKSILRNQEDDESVFMKSAICDIFKDIKKDGDKAVLKFIERFDKLRLKELTTSSSEYNRAGGRLTKEIKSAIHTLKEKIEAYHTHQLTETKVIETTPGVRCWQKSFPIEKVGIVVEGGENPMISTLLMLAVPARMAGCKEIIVCSTPKKSGRYKEAFLYAAQLAGVTAVYKIGGVQAFAALAFGTETVPRVYKIFGSNNSNCSLVKHLVANVDVEIGIPEGPTELAVIADSSSNPVFIAADLLSQGEHGDDTELLFVTDDKDVFDKVEKELVEQYKKTKDKRNIAEALRNCRMILLHGTEDIIDMVNDYAPEHLIINTKKFAGIAEKIKNAGTILLGEFSPQSAADYATGVNHTLPSKGYAKACSGITIDSYMKKISFQELNKSGLKILMPTIRALAKEEKLPAHKNAVEIRLK